MDRHKENGVVLTQAGQPRPYADTTYTGTVTATSEQDAKDRIHKALGYKLIRDTQCSVAWSSPYFKRFEPAGDGKWSFQVALEFTD